LRRPGHHRLAPGDERRVAAPSAPVMVDLDLRCERRTRAVACGSMASPQARIDIDELFEAHRRELTGYCYRMLGSGSEAEDAVQETLVRAWRAADRFEGRSSVRSWLYRIATNVCLDMHRSPQRRARPMHLGGPST